MYSMHKQYTVVQVLHNLLYMYHFNSLQDPEASFDLVDNDAYPMPSNASHFQSG